MLQAPVIHARRSPCASRLVSVWSRWPRQTRGDHGAAYPPTSLERRASGTKQNVHSAIQSSSLSHQPSAVSHQPPAINQQPSAISHQPSAISLQPSASNQRSQQPAASNHQPSAISHQPLAFSLQSSVLSRSHFFFLRVYVADLD